MKLTRYIRLDPATYEDSEEYALAQLASRSAFFDFHKTLDAALADSNWGEDCPVLAVTIELEPALLQKLKTTLNESLDKEALAALGHSE